MIWLAVVVLLLPAAGLLYQAIGVRRDAGRFPSPGRIVNGLHFHQTGGGGPTVILEAGIAASSLSWRLVQEPLSREFTVASYDRAGLAWSQARSTPRITSPKNGFEVVVTIIPMVRPTLDFVSDSGM